MRQSATILFACIGLGSGLGGCAGQAEEEPGARASALSASCDGLRKAAAKVCPDRAGCEAIRRQIQDNGCELHWFKGCGDSVCRGWVDKGLPLCTDVAGDPCVTTGARCDLQTGCNDFLVCAAEDPRPADGCPISRRDRKRDIVYLDATARNQMASSLRDFRLATWRYTTEPAAAPTHLGFIIDDVGSSPAVREGGDMVDLYGYTSMAVAAIQQQQEEIRRLQGDLKALRLELKRTRSRR